MARRLSLNYLSAKAEKKTSEIRNVAKATQGKPPRGVVSGIVWIITFNLEPKIQLRHKIRRTF